VPAAPIALDTAAAGPLAARPDPDREQGKIQSAVMTMRPGEVKQNPQAGSRRAAKA